MAILKDCVAAVEKKTWISHVRHINNSGKYINWRNKIGQLIIVNLFDNKYSERSIWVLLTDTDHDKTLRKIMSDVGFFLRAWLFF